jgi:tetratricopeptide (TPR) repeat protein
MADFRKMIAVAVAAAMLVLAAGLGAQDKDEVSEALKLKYGPLMDDYKRSMDAGAYDAALKRILDIRAGIEKEKELNPVHPVTLQIGVAAAQAYEKLGKYKEAESVLADLISRLKARKMEETQYMLFLLGASADLYKMSGNAAKLKEAQAKLDPLAKKHPEWLAESDGQGGGGGDQEAQQLKDRAQEAYRLWEKGDADGALEAAKRVVADAEAKFGPDSGAAQMAYRTLADLDMMRRDFDGAEALYSKLVSALDRGGKSPQVDLLFILMSRREVYLQTGRDELAAKDDARIQELVATSGEIRKAYEEDLKKREQKQAEMGPKQAPGGSGGSSDPKAQKYFDQLGKIDQRYKGGDRDGAARDLEGLVKQAGSELKAQDGFFVQASMQLARYYSEGGNPARAVEILGPVLVDRDAIAKSDPSTLSAAYRGMGDALDRSGDQKTAVYYYELAWQTGKAAVERAKGSPSSEGVVREALGAGEALANAYSRQKRADDAAAVFKAVDDLVQKQAPDDLLTLGLLVGQAQSLAQSGSAKELEALLARIVALADKVSKAPAKAPAPGKGEGDQFRLYRVQAQVAELYFGAGKPQAALDLAAKARSAAEKDKPAYPSLQALWQLAGLYERAGKPKDAEQLYLSILPDMEKSADKNKSGDLGEYYRSVGRFYSGAGRKPAEAEKYFSKAADSFARLSPPDVGRQIEALGDLRQVLSAEGKSAEAVKVIDRLQSLRASTQASGGDPRGELNDAWERANALRGQGDQAGAEKAIEDMVASIGGKYGEASEAYGLALIDKGYFYNPNPGSAVDAAGLVAKGASILEKARGDPMALAEAYGFLGRTAQNRQAYDEAEGYLGKAVAILRPMGPESGASYRMQDLARLYLAAGTKPAEAEKLLAEAMSLNARRQQPDGIWQGFADLDLAQLATAQARYAEAEKALKEAETLFAKAAAETPDFRPNWRDLYERLAAVYEAKGDAASAQAYRDKAKAARP